MAQIKEKIKHFLHHDKADKETTPGASPGYADVQSVQTNTTTNVPEAFYPGSRPVIPQETHPTAPYTGALGENEPTMKFEIGDESTTVKIALETFMPGAPTNGSTPRQAPAVPQDSAGMLGMPPMGGHMTSTQPEGATPTPLPSPADKRTGDNAEQTPETQEDTATPLGPEDLDKDLPMVPVSDVKTIDSPVTKSDLQGKNYPEEGPQEDVQGKDYTGTELEGEGPQENVQGKDYTGTEFEGESKDHPESVSDLEPTEGKPEDESTDKTPEDTNLENNSSYSPVEEHTEVDPPATQE